MRAAVADEFSRAFGAIGTVKNGVVAVAFRNLKAESVRKVPRKAPPLITRLGSVRHFGLERFAGKPIGAAVFYEHRAGFEKGKRGVGRPAFLGKLLNPFPVTRTFAAVVFAACRHLIKTRCSEIRRKRHRPQQRGAADAAVFGRNGKELRQAFVGSFLGFGGDREHDVLPSVAPVDRKAPGDALRAFREKIKLEVAPFTHDGPGFLAPRVGVFQKEVARHTYPDEFAGAIFEITLTISLDGNCAVGGAVDAAPVLPARFVQSVHVAVLAAFAYFDATVPGIPNVVHGEIKQRVPNIPRKGFVRI